MLQNDPYAIAKPPQVAEYNVNGDSANGLTGTQTPGAMLNRAQQIPKAGNNNPYMGVVDAMPAAANRKQMNPGAPRALTSTATPPPVAMPPQNANADPYANVIAGMQGGAQPQTVASPASQPLSAPMAQQSMVRPSDPVGGVPNWLKQANQLSSLPGYEWLAQRPDVSQAFIDFAQGNKLDDLDMVDWLATEHPEIWNTLSDQAKSLYKRSGRDTYFTNADGSTRSYLADPGVGNGDDPNEPLDTAAYRYVKKAPGFFSKALETDTATIGNYIGEYRQFALTNKINGLDFVDWFAHTHPGLLGANAQNYVGRSGTDTYLYMPNPNGSGWVPRTDLPGGGLNGGGGTIKPPHVDPGPTDGGGGTPISPPPINPGDPQIKPPHVDPGPGAGGGGGNGGGGGTGGGLGDGGATGIIDETQRNLDPSFQWQREQLRRGMNAQGALTGDINAEGFNEQAMRAQTQLIGEQGVQLNQGIKDALDRALSKYGIDTNANVSLHQIDTQKAIAEMQDATARFNIKTTTDLQKYLGDADNALKKYGIDQNVFMERLRAQTGLSEAQIAAGAQISSAQINAAIQSAAIEQRRQEADQNFQVQLGQLGLDKYKWDNPSMNALLAAYLNFTPEEIAKLGLDPNLFPGYIYGKKP